MSQSCWEVKSETLIFSGIAGRFNSSLFKTCNSKFLICFLSYTVTERDKGSTEAIQTKQNNRFLRQAFDYWAKMTRKSQDAKRYYIERLLPK